MMVANVCNYLFQILMGRMLTPSDYGTLNALMSLITTLSVFGTILSLSAARETSYYHTLKQDDRVRKLIRGLFGITLIFAVCILLAGGLVSSFVSKLLKIDSPALVALTMLVVAVSGLHPVFMGTLQGLKRFVPYGTVGILSSAVKLVLSVYLLLLGWRLYGVLAALFLSAAVSLAYCLYCLRGYFRFSIRPITVKAERAVLLSSLNSVFWIQLLTAIVSNCDILLIKAFSVDSAEVGIYSSGMVIGRISMYVASAVIAALFPLVAQTSADRKDPRPLYVKAMLYGGGVALLCTLGMNIFGRLIIRILFGETYLSVVPLLLPIGVLMLAITFITIQMNYLVALRHTKVYGVSLALGCALIGALVAVFHNDIAQIVYIIASVLYAVFLINLISILFGKQTSGQLVEEAYG